MGVRLLTSAWRNYRYLGGGEANDVAGSVNWHPNSRNIIGRGR